VDFEEGEEFEVEKIVNSRIKKGHLQYLVKWKGFTDRLALVLPCRGLNKQNSGI
jgi:hypothetical protein